MSTDLSKLPVHVLADKLKSRSVSPVDLVATCLDRIAKLDPKLHAFIEIVSCLSMLRHEFLRRQITETGMWTHRVVMPAPALDHYLGLCA